MAKFKDDLDEENKARLKAFEKEIQASKLEGIDRSSAVGKYGPSLKGGAVPLSQLAFEKEQLKGKQQFENMIQNEVDMGKAADDRKVKVRAGSNVNDNGEEARPLTFNEKLDSDSIDKSDSALREFKDATFNQMKSNVTDTRRAVEAQVAEGNLDTQTGKEVLAKLDRGPKGIDASRISFEIAKAEGKAPKPADSFLNGMSLILAPLLGGAIGGLLGGTEGFVAGAGETQKVANQLYNYEQNDMKMKQSLRKEQQAQANFEKEMEFKERKRKDKLAKGKDKRFMKTNRMTESGDPIGMEAGSGQLYNLSTNEPLPKGAKTVDEISRRQAQAFSQQLKVKGDFSDKQADDIGKTIVLKRRLNELNFDKNIWGGPIKSRISSLKNRFGLTAGAKFDEVNVKTVGILNQYLRDMSGAALTESEAVRLGAELPNAKDSAPVFFKKLNVFKRNLDMKIDTKLKVIEATQGLKSGSVKRIKDLINGKSLGNLDIGLGKAIPTKEEIQAELKRRKGNK